jgi:hypothetical protein
VINCLPYRAGKDGNVFDWIVITAAALRVIRQRERHAEFKKAATKSQVLDRPKVED